MALTKAQLDAMEKALIGLGTNFGTGPAYSSNNKLLPMQFKTYTWPYNPSTYNIKFSKRIIQHVYLNKSNAELEDMGVEARVMSGSGSFFGTDAYKEFARLASVFYDSGPGTLTHPLWQSTNVIFSKLDLKQDQMPNCVDYDFEFVEHIEINTFVAIDVTDSNVATTASKASSAVQYTVAQGDTLSGIGTKFGVSWRQIADDNKNIISDPNVISIGMVLTINGPNSHPAVKKSQTVSGTGDPAYDRYVRDVQSVNNTSPDDTIDSVPSYYDPNQ